MSKKTGDWGEKIALQYLQKEGINILHNNWRSGHLEFDIVGTEGQVLVFFEVKVRRLSGIEKAIHSISNEQIRRLGRAAFLYMNTYDFDGEVRFDIIGITYYDEENYKIEHIRDAFFPGNFW